jgi:SAM-dependent methyltransferase
MRPAPECLLCGASPSRSRPARFAPFVAHRTGAALPSAFALLACNACDFAWFSHRFEGTELARLYAGYRGPAYTAERRRFEPTYGQEIGQLGDENEAIRAARAHDVRAMCTPFVGAPTRVLDFGGGSEPWLARGAFPDARAELHDLGAGLVAAGAAFDLVIAARVLEHVSYPLETLAEARSFVAPGGWLYVDIPLGPSPLERFLALDGPAVCHEHVSYFTPRALQITLVRAGFAVAPRVAHHAALGKKVSGPFAARALQRFCGTRVERWRGWEHAQRFA